MQLTLLDGLMASYETPLAYIGGKKKLWSLFKNHIPPGIDLLVSPFVGGGAIELRSSAQGIKVKAFDNFQLLTEFWEEFIKDAGKVGSYASKIFPISEDEGAFYLETNLSTISDKLQKAAIFWCINKQTWSCSMFANKSWKRDDQIMHDKNYFLKWDNWSNNNITIKHQDCFETIEKYDGCFMYLDPPYVGLEKMYGIKGENMSFDHERLYEAISNSNSPWIMSYGKHEDIYKMYGNYKIIEPEWYYSFNSNMKSNANEVVIINT